MLLCVQIIWCCWGDRKQPIPSSVPCCGRQAMKNYKASEPAKQRKKHLLLLKTSFLSQSRTMRERHVETGGTTNGIQYGRRRGKVGVWRWKRMGARKEENKVTELKGQGGEKMMCVSVRSSYSKLIETLKNCVFVFGRSFLYGSFCGQEVCHCKSWREKHLWLSLCVLSLQPVTCDLRSLISGLFFNAHFDVFLTNIYLNL